MPKNILYYLVFCYFYLMLDIIIVSMKLKQYSKISKFINLMKI